MRTTITKDGAMPYVEPSEAAADGRVTASVGDGDARPNERAPLIAAARDDAGKVDAVAGSEFVDDLIRVRE